MALVIVGWLLGACAFAYQGIYVLRTGHTTLFLVRPLRAPSRSGGFRRTAYSLLYLLPAAAMTVILATALAKSGMSRLETWLVANMGILFGSLLFLLLGLLLLTQPAGVVRHTIRDNPELAERKSAVVTTRFIGVWFIGMAMVMLSGL